MKFAILILPLFGLYVILRHCYLRTDLPFSYRAQNSCLAFCLIFSSAFGINLFIWGLFHPSRIYGHLYAQSWVFPPMAALLMRMLSICADFLMVVIGFEMVRQRRRARSLANKSIPFIAIIGIMGTGMDVSTRGLTHPVLVKVMIPVFVVLKLGFYFWAFRFFRDKQTEELMNALA